MTSPVISYTHIHAVQFLLFTPAASALHLYLLLPSSGRTVELQYSQAHKYLSFYCPVFIYYSIFVFLLSLFVLMFTLTHMINTM